MGAAASDCAHNAPAKWTVAEVCAVMRAQSYPKDVVARAHELGLDGKSLQFTPEGDLFRSMGVDEDIAIDLIFDLERFRGMCKSRIKTVPEKQLREALLNQRNASGKQADHALGFSTKFEKVLLGVG